jgi:hypothetical protein
MPRKIIVFMWVWLAVGIAAAIAISLLRPDGLVKWALWAVAILPIGILANAAVEGAVCLFMSLPGIKHGTRYFEKRAEGKNFSFARAAWYGLSAILGFILAITIATVVWHGYSLASEYISQDKCLDNGGQWKTEEHKCKYQNETIK